MRRVPQRPVVLVRLKRGRGLGRDVPRHGPTATRDSGPIGQWQFSVSVTAAFWNTRGGSPTSNVNPSDTTTLPKPDPRLAQPLPSRAWLD